MVFWQETTKLPDTVYELKNKRLLPFSVWSVGKSPEHFSSLVIAGGILIEHVDLVAGDKDSL